MFELIYTSVPRGLIPGRSGFCTVAMTEGMPPNLVVPLENLSGYNFTYLEGALPPMLNPPSCSYIKMRYGNQHLHIASQVMPNGLDYSQRNNKIAHHILFESADEMNNLSGGVAGLFIKAGVFCKEYTEAPSLLPFRKVPVCLQQGALPARKWAELAGHAGFAAVAAERFKHSPDRPLYLIYPQGTPVNDLLELVMEVCSLLNEHVRNYFTFSTYFGSGNASADCFLRMVPEFSPLVSNLRRFHRQEIIELGQDNELPDMVEDEALYEYACTGRPPVKILEDNTRNFTQNTIRIISESTLPRTQTPVMPESDSQPAISIPPPQDSRKYIFITAAAVIVAAIAALFLIVMPAKDNVKQSAKKEIEFTPEQKTSSNTGKKSELPINAPTAPANSMPISGDETYEQQPAAVPAKNPAVKKKAVPVKQMDLFGNPRALKSAKTLTATDELALFAAFQMLDQGSKYSKQLKLPKALQEADEVYIVFSKLGTATVSGFDFIRKLEHSNGIGVAAAHPGTLPLKPYAGSLMDIPHVAIKMDRGNGVLRFDTVNPNPDCILLNLQDIENIYWSTPTGIFKWSNKFSDRMLKAVKPGVFSIQPGGILKYTPGDIEKQLKHYLKIKFGNADGVAFLTGAFDFDSFNKAAADFRLVEKNSRKMETQLKKRVLHASPQTKSEFEKECSDITRTASEADYRLAESLMTSLLKKQFSPGDRDAVSLEKIKEFVAETTKILQDKISTEKEEKILERHAAAWKKLIDALNRFRQQKKNFSVQKNLLEKQRSLLQDRARMNLQKANSVSPEVAALLKQLMASAKNKNYDESPGSIDSKDIEILSGAIARRIHFEHTRETENSL